ncbi:replication-relaxation family protein [Micromonospora sp. WMMD1274]|uniref:replication-relaxation family protein n=1 Tax=Micromonospora sp. WMMD1274 TaxID=3404116 RepID=UPI0011014413
MPQSRSDGLLAIYPHITSRDRQLLQLLDGHQVLTTDQIHALFFLARRTCQIRLGELYRLGLLDRFRFARDGGGSQPWHWTLGHNGHRFQAAAHNRPEPTARTSRQQMQRLSANPNLTHLLTATEFGVRLSAYARSHPAAELSRWWPETKTAARFSPVTPDGHGLWSEDGTTVGYWLEADTGSEPLGKLAAKLDKYAALARKGGPRYPVLFWLPSEDREEHLHAYLRGRRPEGVLVATATHSSDPADAVWLPVGDTQRVRLAGLPSDHGRVVAANSNYDENGVFLT